jgi:hypothetical protein
VRGRDAAFHRGRHRFKRGLALGILVLAACSSSAKTGGNETPTPAAGGGSASIVGRYNCRHPDSTEDVVEIKGNGTVRVTRGGQTTELTWSLQGNRGAFNLPGRPEPDRFTVENGRLIFDEGSSCTRTT